MTAIIYDLAIAGAGCAGLSLAARLAEHAPGMKVIVIDPRSTFEDDRTWCFWTQADTPVEKLITHRWHRWHFSAADGGSVTHEASSRYYACVRAQDFYAASLADIRKAGFTLSLNDRIHNMKPALGGLRIATDKGEVFARLAVDTRPQRHPRARLFQVFAGVEIETEDNRFNPDQAGLMEEMTSDADGFRFIYTLPYSPKHALIELTRFAPASMNPALLNGELDRILAQRGLGKARLLRREQGVLPMGQRREPPPADRRIIRAGITGGALRAASGYGFLRIQHWAEACARSLAQGGPLLAHPAEPFLRGWMDNVFLEALRADPVRAPSYFLKLAEALRAEGFARFMSDAASPADLLHIVKALPPLPFIRAAARSAGSEAYST